MSIKGRNLNSALRTGHIQLPLTTARAIASNDIGVIAVGGAGTVGSGGLLGSDGSTAPKLSRVNGATDKQLRIAWAAAVVTEIQFSFVTPPDMDDEQPLTAKFLAAMAGATDTPTLSVVYLENAAGAYAADTNAGGATAAVTGTSVAVYSRAIAIADIGPAPAAATITVTPGAHGTDILYMYGAWIEYTRK